MRASIAPARTTDPRIPARVSPCDRRGFAHNTLLLSPCSRSAFKLQLSSNCPLHLNSLSMAILSGGPIVLSLLYPRAKTHLASKRRTHYLHRSHYPQQPSRSWGLETHQVSTRSHRRCPRAGRRFGSEI